jgi:cell division protein FtsA
MTKKDSLFVGLDIGTTKICAIIGEASPEGNVEIIGIGKAPSHGLRKGVVIDIETTVQSIKQAVEEAELMAGVTIERVFTGIAGGHIKGFNSRGVIAVSGKNREITQRDVDRVIDAARAVAIPLDREVIHILPQEFIVDDQVGIKKPLGMYGVRLEADVHIVTGAVTSAQNIVKSVNNSGLEVADIVLQQLASAEAVLTPDEKELGVALIDMGGGTTDLAIFVEGSIWHTAVLSLGGNNITNDIAMGLQTPTHEAEEIKKQHGCAMASLIDPEEIIEVPSVGGRPPRKLARQVLCAIIEPRVEEIFDLVNREIRKAGYQDLIAGGIVMTGGGASLEGICELGEQIFGKPTRMGLPTRIGGLADVVSSPMYSTGVGLVLYGLRHQEHTRFQAGGRDQGFFGIFKRMKEWFSDLL